MVSLQEAFAEYNRTRFAHPPSRRHISSVLQRDLLRVLEDRPVASISRRDIALVLDEMEARGSPITANRVLQHTKAMFNALAERELVPAPHCDHAQAHARTGAR